MATRLLLSLMLCVGTIPVAAGCDSVRELGAAGDVVPYLEWIKYEPRTVPTPTVGAVLSAWGQPAKIERREGRIRRLEYWMRGIDGDLKFGSLTFDRNGLLVAKVVT